MVCVTPVVLTSKANVPLNAKLPPGSVILEDSLRLAARPLEEINIARPALNSQTLLPPSIMSIFKLALPEILADEPEPLIDRNNPCVVESTFGSATSTKPLVAVPKVSVPTA